MKKVNIVLYSPEIPQNTGNISRTAAVTGAALHLIRPFGFEITDRNLKRAGLDYWDKLDITYYDSFEDFKEKNPDAQMYFFTSHTERHYTDVSYPDNVYLVFGRETAGLPPEIVEPNKERAVRIPMRPTLRCLNLSNAVAIAVYEALRQADFEDLI
ncbi:MAG: tRNA (cytidine(34)-2'-O)-methyltransferase [Clostridia bacterium]|nr:tRNA (cytidine(34)-2'-O)-methyltransferase [Clostridia bacterium]